MNERVRKNGYNVNFCSIKKSFVKLNFYLFGIFVFIESTGMAGAHILAERGININVCI